MIKIDKQSGIYTILEVIGRSGMTKVHKVLDTIFKKIALQKFITKNMADTDHKQNTNPNFSKLQKLCLESHDENKEKHFHNSVSQSLQFFGITRNYTSFCQNKHRAEYLLNFKAYSFGKHVVEKSLNNIPKTTEFFIFVPWEYTCRAGSLKQYYRQGKEQNADKQYRLSGSQKKRFDGQNTYPEKAIDTIDPIKSQLPLLQQVGVGRSN